MAVFVCVCSESAKGSEPCGTSEEEDERAGVVAAASLSHNPLLHPQQARKGVERSSVCHWLVMLK